MDGVKFYGVPMFIEDCITDRQSRNYASIPDDTDVLITHSPAYGILDFDDGINYGSEEILSRISESYPKPISSVIFMPNTVSRNKTV